MRRERARLGAVALLSIALSGSCVGGTTERSKTPLLHAVARSTARGSSEIDREAGVEAGDAALGAAVADASTRGATGAWPRSDRPSVATDWCIDKVSALDEGACYVLPDQPTRTLLIYFHGIVPPTKDSPQKTNVETVVANATRRAGIAALIPRGKQGLAPRGREGWWGWPTSEASYDEHAAALLAVVAEKREKLERIARVSFGHVYVAGSSSGAYFATRLAVRGGIEAEGFAAISGGGPADASGLTKLAPKPFYIGYGKNDGTVRGSAIALADLLRRAGWPVRTAEHAVDHGAHEVYIDEAVAFFRDHDR